MFRKITTEDGSALAANMRQELSCLIELLQANLVELYNCVSQKRFQKFLPQLEEMFGGRLTTGKKKPPLFIKNIEQLTWVTPQNYRKVVARMRIFNDEVEMTTIGSRRDEILKYEQFIEKRPLDALAHIPTNSLTLGQFGKIRKTTRFEYLCLCGKQPISF